MKLSLISICLVVLSYGCSKDTPTATAPTLDTPTTTAPKLDTTKKTHSAVITIQRWDGEDWINTNSKLALSMTWRFISHLERDDGGVLIKGGYTLEASNPIAQSLVFTAGKLSFNDKDGIPIHETSYNFEFSDIEWTLSANSTDRYSGTFEILLDNISVANQITRMAMWASATIPVE